MVDFGVRRGGLGVRGHGRGNLSVHLGRIGLALERDGAKVRYFTSLLEIGIKRNVERLFMLLGYVMKVPLLYSRVSCHQASHGYELNEARVESWR